MFAPHQELGLKMWMYYAWQRMTIGYIGKQWLYQGLGLKMWIYYGKER